MNNLPDENEEPVIPQTEDQILDENGGVLIPKDPIKN